MLTLLTKSGVTVKIYGAVFTHYDKQLVNAARWEKARN